MNFNNTLTNGSLVPVYSWRQVTTFQWSIRAALFPTLNTLHCFIFYIILKFPTDFKSSYYSFVIALSVTDFVISFDFLFDIFIPDMLQHRYLNVICDNILIVLNYNFGWNANYAIMFCIGINRLCAIIFYSRYNSLFTRKVTVIMIVSSFFAGCVFHLPFFISCGVLINFQSRLGFFLNPPPVCNNIITYFKILSVIYIWFSSGLLIVFYIVTFAFSFYKLKTFTGQKSIYKKEIKLLCQAVFTFTFLLITNILNWFPQYYAILGELTWMYPLINPIAYLLFDPKIREHCRSLLGIKKFHISSSTAVVAVNTNGQVDTTQL